MGSVWKKDSAEGRSLLDTDGKKVEQQKEEKEEDEEDNLCLFLKQPFLVLF